MQHPYEDAPGRRVQSTATRQQLEWLLCPSDPAERRGGFTGGNPAARFDAACGDNNYRGNLGGRTHASNSRTNGIFNDERALGVRDIVDGTANTAVFSERNKGTAKSGTAVAQTDFRQDLFLAARNFGTSSNMATTGCPAKSEGPFVRIGNGAP